MCDLPCDTGGPKFNKLSDIETEVLKYRFGFNIVNLCHEHYLDQFSRYTNWHSRKCADPCNRHKKARKTGLTVISLETAKSVKNKTEYSVIPGQSICRTCLEYLDEIMEDTEDEEVGGGSKEENADEGPLM